jgi:predicted dehydrogenase
MKAHPPINVLIAPARPGFGSQGGGRSPDDPGRLGAVAVYWSSMPHVRVDWRAELPEDLGGAHVVVTDGGDLDEPGLSAVERFVRAGGGWLAFVDGREDGLPSLFGVQPAAPLPTTEVRVRLARPADPLVVRLPDEIYIRGPFRAFDETVAGDVEVVACADWQYRRLPVLVRRAVGGGSVACTTLGGLDHPGVLQLLYRVVRALAGRPLEPAPLRVGLVGYPPSVGRVHGEGIGATPGLELRFVADLDHARLEEAGREFPGVQVDASGEGIAAHPEVDLVVVATPPDSHARLALRMLDAGKHVICEKPLALGRREAEAMAAAADARGLHLGCHQNRRWDVDYRAIRQARDEGLLGDLFFMETFVGGFAHPCGRWHSHAPISGGTTFDWGAHYLDWIVSLIPDRVVGVTGTSHKRVWHDVTNADQERIGIRFAGGQEAEFLHSDIAAVRKPKWYVLGTAGAIVGNWRDETSYEPDPVVYYHRHDYPATEVPPDLTLYRPHRSGQVLAQELALPPRDAHGFHRNLADHLLTGEPLTAPLEDSMKVVAILEAAARSASRGGLVEAIDG